MNNIALIFFGIIISYTISAQCYIQYTYDTSGNRIKREYTGGCFVEKNVVKEQLIELVADSISSMQTANRKELFRHDIDGTIKVYPNPTDGVITLYLDNYEPTWVYKLTSLSGQLLQQSLVAGPQVMFDISSMPASPYIFVICDSGGQIIYKTNIIKQ